MKAVIQRVKRASVRCGELEATIGPGLLVLAGLEAGDTEETCAWAAAKIASLRVGGLHLDLDGVLEPLLLEGLQGSGRRSLGAVRRGLGGETQAGQGQERGEVRMKAHADPPLMGTCAIPYAGILIPV